MKPADSILGVNPIIFQMRTKAAGPAGRLPLNEEMLKDWSSGDLFGLTQNVGMGWTASCIRVRESLGAFLISACS